MVSIFLYWHLCRILFLKKFHYMINFMKTSRKILPFLSLIKEGSWKSQRITNKVVCMNPVSKIGSQFLLLLCYHSADASSRQMPVQSWKWNLQIELPYFELSVFEFSACHSSAHWISAFVYNFEHVFLCWRSG